MRYMQFNDLLVVSTPSGIYSIQKGDERYAKVKELIEAGRLEEAAQVANYNSVYYKIRRMFEDSLGLEQP